MNVSARSSLSGRLGVTGLGTCKFDKQIGYNVASPKIYTKSSEYSHC